MLALKTKMDAQLQDMGSSGEVSGASCRLYQFPDDLRPCSAPLVLSQWSELHMREQEGTPGIPHRQATPESLERFATRSSRYISDPTGRNPQGQRRLYGFLQGF